MIKLIIKGRIHQIILICLLLAMLPAAGFAQELQSDPLTITGKVEYLGQDGAYHDASYIWVEAWEKQALIDYKIAEGYTAGDGTFTFTHDTNGDPILNEDPGIGESGTRDIFFKIRAQNEAAQVSADWVSGVLGTVYWFDSDPESDVAGPTYSRNFQFDSTGDSPTHAAGWGLPGEIKSHRDWLWNNTSPNYARESVDVLFPDDSWPNFWGPLIYNCLRIPETWDTTFWENSKDTIAHEYGHAVHWSVRGGGLGLPTENVPTGEEDPSNGTQDAGKGAHWVYSESSGGFALTEGWAEFFQCTRYNDPTLVRWPGLEGNDYWMGADGNGPLGPNTDGTTGEIVEGAFASILWDLYDPANDDGVDGNFNKVWTVFADYHPDRVWSQTFNDDFYHYWNAQYGQSRAVDEIFIDHGIPVYDDPYDNGAGNDNSGSASNLGDITGQKMYTGLVVTDPDWHKFAISAAGDSSSKVSIAFDNNRGNLDLYVYRSDGTTLVGYSSSSFSDIETVSLNGEPAGVYMIRVVGKGDDPATNNIYEGDFSPNYSLSINGPCGGGPDSFGYTYTDSNCPAGPTYNWIEISSAGTEVLPSSDDSYTDVINMGFFFNYYGTDYSQIKVGNNGLLFEVTPTSQYVNQPITQTPGVHGFIAPFWDDIVTWGSAGSIYYRTLGSEPNRKFVVEWKDNQHYHDSTSGITFEAILYEGSNNILFQYQDVDFGTVSGSTSSDLPPYDNGGSATVGIEGPTGDVGLQYSFNEQVIDPGLAILFKFPQFAGTNLFLSKQAPAQKDHGSTMIYSLHYHNFGDTTAQNVVLRDTLPSDIEFISASDGGTYDLGTGNVTWSIGSVAPLGHNSVTVTVRIKSDVPVGTIIQNNARISTSTLEVRYDDNEAHAQTSVTGSSLPPDVGVEPNNGGGPTPSVYYGDPITFSYDSCPGATGVHINIHIDDGGPDIGGPMVGGPPHWTYTVTFYPRHGEATVNYTVTGPCSGNVTFNIYIDPAGYIYDIGTNERISGASVWLQHPDGSGGWENVPTGAIPPVMQPEVNPQITGVDGQYQWDVLAGSYRVHVEAPGYYPSDSIVVSIPPPVTDLHVGLTPLPNLSTPVSGITRQVNGSILPVVSITLDGIGPVVSDQDGYYEIMATATGDYTVTAHKDGFRDRTQTISIAGLGAGYAVTCNFQGNLGLIPNAPDMWYALDCVNRWLYPPNPDTGLDMWTALDVINAWLYPVMQPPCAFHGTVQVNGQNVADGTVITAKLGNDTYTSTTPSAAGVSTYRIVITQPEGKNYDGETVIFMIGNAVATQTATWTMGGNVQVNLTAFMPTLTPPPPDNTNPPCRFHGTVQLNGANVADGTVITAMIEGYSYTTTTPADYGTSTFAIIIPKATGISYEGKTVIFMIGNAIATQIATWTMGGNVLVNLTAFN